MSTASNDNLLEQPPSTSADTESRQEVAATRPAEEAGDCGQPEDTPADAPVACEGTAAPAASDPKLSALLQKINTISPEKLAARAALGAPPEESADDVFIPKEPKTFRQAGLTESELESLVLKLQLARGDVAGRAIADCLRLPFGLVNGLLARMKNDQLVAYRDSAPMNDYVYQLTEVGRERARRLNEHCSYYGAAPVALADYFASVKTQSLSEQHPTVDNLREAFSDLLVNAKMLERLGPAINSGRGLFLFGAPGNGKTSIAERVTRAFGEHIWIPRSIGIDGEVMRLFDPMNHEEAALPANSGLLQTTKVDQRWVRIKRPTIVVGGELTMDALEVVFNRSTGVSESPVQLKSNCGTLVIDDFGRQRMTTDELLNRWIVPLEKRYDFLSLANGKKIQVPFDQLIIFSTNLEPKDLVDEAFLRRIPYKIEVLDPSEDEFRKLFKIMCPKMGFEYDENAVDYLISRHYLDVQRPFRNCQPRDLLMQVRNHCYYQDQELQLTPESFDFAAENYFSVL